MYNPKLIRDYFQKNNILLAPMAGVTDRCFRSLCKEEGCGMTYTEMVSAKGLHYNKKDGKSKALLQVAENETPVIVQLFGNHPEILAEQAQIICTEMNEQVAWIDVNMGCPAPKITKNGDGSALMRHPELAAEIIQKVNDAIDKPLTVKFRLGWNDQLLNAIEFAKMAEDSGASAICIHGRTREQFYSGKADWETTKTIKQHAQIPVIGNGDIFSAKDAKEKLEMSHVDALLIARGAQGNPWIFSQISAYLNQGVLLPMPTPQERVTMALRHAKGLMVFRGDHAIVEMRKHVSWYIAGMHHASRIRADINRCCTFEELEETLFRLLDEQEVDEQVVS